MPGRASAPVRRERCGSSQLLASPHGTKATRAAGGISKCTEIRDSGNGASVRAGPPRMDLESALVRMRKVREGRARWGV